MADQPTFPGSTYAGKAAGKYISAALLSAPTIENGGVTVLENVKFKEVLQTLDTNTLLTDLWTEKWIERLAMSRHKAYKVINEKQVQLELGLRYAHTHGFYHFRKRDIQ